MGFDTPNLVSSLGYVVMAAGVIAFLIDVWVSLRRRVPAGDDPWGGYSLEWATTSPPPEQNFESLPADPLGAPGLRPAPPGARPMRTATKFLVRPVGCSAWCSAPSTGS